MSDIVKDEEVMIDLCEEDAISTDLKLEETVNPFVLGQLVGPFMIIEEDNGNGRYYLRETIQKEIIDNDYVKQMIAAKTLLGESHHPQDRTSIWSDQAAISTRELWLDSTGKVLMGRADILDTPNGRIVNTLARYGARLGISARANGKGVKQGSHLVIKPENYYFKTFDVVLNPGFAQARPTYLESDGTPMKIYEESTISGLYEELSTMIKNKSCDLNNLKSFIEYSENEKLSGLLPLFEEGATDTPETDTSVKRDDLQEELDSLKVENSKLKAYKVNAQSDRVRKDEQMSLLMEELDTIKIANQKLLEDLESAQDRSDSYDFVQTLLEEIEGLRRSLSQKEVLLKDCRELFDMLDEESFSLDKEENKKELAIEVSKEMKEPLSEEKTEDGEKDFHSSTLIEDKVDFFGLGEVTLNEQIEEKQLDTHRVNLIKSIGGI